MISKKSKYLALNKYYRHTSLKFRSAYILEKFYTIKEKSLEKLRDEKFVFFF